MSSDRDDEGLASYRQHVDRITRECAQLRSELDAALKLNGHLLDLNDQLRSERDRLRQLVQQIWDQVTKPGRRLNYLARLIDESGLLDQTSNEETA